MVARVAEDPPKPIDILKRVTGLEMERLKRAMQGRKTCTAIFEDNTRIIIVVVVVA